MSDDNNKSKVVNLDQSIAANPDQSSREDLLALHARLKRLQAEVNGGLWVWRAGEREALVTVMDAILDTSGSKRAI